MSDENGTETTPPDSLNVAEILFGDAADNTDAAWAEKDTNLKAGRVREDSDKSEEQAATEDAEAPEELKVVLSIKGGRATIGVQGPSSDPHIESFDGLDLSALVKAVAAVTERGMAKWQEEPRHPAHERPAPPARRRNRREQAPEEASDAEEGTEDQQQPETLRLF